MRRGWYKPSVCSAYSAAGIGVAVSSRLGRSCFGVAPSDVADVFHVCSVCLDPDWSASLGADCLSVCARACLSGRTPMCTSFGAWLPISLARVSPLHACSHICCRCSLSAFSANRTHVYVMTPFYGRGDLLKSVVQGVGMGEDNARRWFRQIFLGLGYMHAKVKRMPSGRLTGGEASTRRGRSLSCPIETPKPRRRSGAHAPKSAGKDWEGVEAKHQILFIRLSFLTSSRAACSDCQTSRLIRAGLNCSVGILFLMASVKPCAVVRRRRSFSFVSLWGRLWGCYLIWCCMPRGCSLQAKISNQL